jgi:hypothetical protein
MEEFKKKKEKLSIVAGAYNEISIVKSYLEESQLNLYEILQMWDFRKNGTIIYKHLKDALNVRGFKIDSSIRDLILNLALKFVTDENHKLINIDNSEINYETLLLELV